MKDKEAKARIIINQLLIDAGWRFFDSEEGKANIQLEPNVKITQQALDSLGEDYQKVKNGFVDYLLLDDNSTPLLIAGSFSSSSHPFKEA